MKNILTYLEPGQYLCRKDNSGFLQVFCSCEEMAGNIKTQIKGTLLHCEGERALAQVAQWGCGLLHSPFYSLEDIENLDTVLGKQLKVSLLEQGTGSADLQRFLPIPAILWFSKCVFKQYWSF